jgi:DNA-binding phage protein
MSVKQIKPFMTNVFLNAENEISDFLVASCDDIQLEGIN